MAIETFTDLKCWQEGHKLTLMIYDATKRFPKEELFGLSAQMRRAAVSVTSNIAEGFGRRSNRERIQFYILARGSNAELQNQLIICRDIRYINPGHFKEIAEQTVLVQRLLNGIIKSSSLLKEPRS